MKPSTSPASKFIAAALVALTAAAGCIDPAEDEPEVGESAAPIIGGAADLASKAVVGIATTNPGRPLCSGVLLAPGLVLAATRCIAPIVNPGPCAGATFGPANAPDTYFISTKSPLTQMPADFHEVLEIRAPPGDPAYCDRDLVLLRLFSLVMPAEGADPLVPRLDTIAAANETYSAIGYGGTADTGAGGGQRRRLDNLRASCVGAACASTSIGTKEWKGGTAACAGDWGGPALDSTGKVIGIASRSGAGCTDSIYSAIAPHKDWLIAETQRAAAMGGFPVPAWAAPAVQIDAGIDAPVGPDAGTTNPEDDDGGGCCDGGRGSRGSLVAAAMAAAAAALLARRRRLEGRGA